MKMLWFYIICWKQRNKPFSELAQQYELTLKAARRCAYDLSHCSSELYMYTDNKNISPWADYESMSRNWLDIFSPDGIKNYRHALHGEISRLESDVDRLRRLCLENGIDPNDPHGIPF